MISNLFVVVLVFGLLACLINKSGQTFGNYAILFTIEFITQDFFHNASSKQTTNTSL